MFLYTMITTMTLTWMILIRPNNYSSSSNAIDWLLLMSLFVFFPMMIVAIDKYQKQLERQRAKVGKEYRLRLDRAAARRYKQETMQDELSELLNLSITSDTPEYSREDGILYTESYSRARFRREQNTHRGSNRTQAA